MNGTTSLYFQVEERNKAYAYHTSFLQALEFKVYFPFFNVSKTYVGKWIYGTLHFESFLKRILRKLLFTRSECSRWHETAWEFWKIKSLSFYHFNINWFNSIVLIEYCKYFHERAKLLPATWSWKYLSNKNKMNNSAATRSFRLVCSNDSLWFRSCYWNNIDNETKAAEPSKETNERYFQ